MLSFHAKKVFGNFAHATIVQNRTQKACFTLMCSQ